MYTEQNIIKMVALEKYEVKNLINNPFATSLEIPVTKVYSSTHFKEELDGEEILKVQESFYIEKTQCTKIFHNPGVKAQVANLTSAGQRLYLHILSSLTPGKDYIQLNIENYMKLNSITSITTYRTGIKDLMRSGFIASSIYKTVFFINPALFFSGDRLKKYPKALKVVGDWTIPTGVAPEIKYNKE